MSTRFTAEGAEVQLDDGLQRWVEDLLESAQTAAIKALRQAGREVAAEAERRWYGPSGVQRRTGKSGDIRVREAVDLRRGLVTVSVGSTDARTVRGKPVVAFVRRPGRTSTILTVVTPKEYFAAPVAMRGPWLPGTPRKPQIFIPNPAASDGAKLLDVFIRRPMRKRVKAIARELGEELSRG